MIKVLCAALLFAAALQCPDDEQCIMCVQKEKSSQCAICEQRILNKITGKCDLEPKEKVQNCLEYKEDKGCINCRFGYRLERKAHQTSCVPCSIRECARCDSDPRVCTHCFHNLKVTVSNTGEFECGPEKASVSFCEINRSGVSEGGCEVCEPGYVVDKNNDCVKSPLEYCWRADSYDKCNVCHWGFYATLNGKCAKKHNIWLTIAVVLAVLTVFAIGFVCLRKKRVFHEGEFLLD